MKRKIMLAVAASVVALLPVMAQAANKLIVKDSTGTTDKMVVTDTGSVGIGTNAPQAALHVKGTAYPGNTIRVEGNATSGSGGYLGYVLKTGALPNSQERLGFIYFGSLNDATNPPTPLHATGMKAAAEAAWTSSSTPAYFAFETTPSGSTTRIERLRIDSVGNVGIGTVGPTQKLEVNGGVRINTIATRPTCDSTIRGTIWISRGTVGVADSVSVCIKQSNESYDWLTL